MKPRLQLACLLALLVALVAVAAHRPKMGGPRPEKPSFAPVLIGRITLGPDGGVVHDPRIEAGMLCVFSVNSPDSLSAGARVSVYQLDDGVLHFWAHNALGQPVPDEPEVHFIILPNAGFGQATTNSKP